MSQLISPAQRELEPSFEFDFSSVKLSPEQFKQLCADNPELRLELTSTGELIVMPPAVSKSGLRNFNLSSQLARWVEEDDSGVGFDSSAGFTLPNAAIRAPDASWIRRDRWEGFGEEEKEEFAPICPDFVIELRSPTDRLATLQAKMQEYVDNGAQLGWLIDPFERRVYIYRPGREMEVLEDPETVLGDPELPGFVLNVRELW